MSGYNQSIDLFSLLAFGAFALAVGYLVWFCLINNANMCLMNKRKKRSAFVDAPEHLVFVYNLLETAQNVWSNLNEM